MGRSSAGARYFDPRRSAVAIGLLLGALALAGCASGPTTTTTTTPTPAAPSTTVEVRAECTAVADAARNVADQMGLLVRGQADREQVAVAGQQLRTALTTARAVVKPEVQANVDAANAAVQQLQTAARATPFDLATLRAAAVQTLDAVGKVLSACAPASPGPSPTVPG